MLGKDTKIVPIHLLKRGARFSFPYKGKDHVFEVDYRANNDTIIAKSEDTPKQWFPLDTMVFVPVEEEEKLRQYITFDSLPEKLPFRWENYSYLKINNREAIRMSPAVGRKEELLVFEQSQGLTGRLPVLAEVDNLPFTPPLARVLTKEDVENSGGQKDIMFWYPVREFSDKAVVSLDWISTE